MKQVICNICVISALTVMATTCLAQERYALLVGVGRYPHLEEQLQLYGPRHDVRLAEEHLLSEGFKPDNVVTLSDERSEPPDRAHIIDALETLKEKVKDGDFVLLYFSGHGSRQPVKANAVEELDGYDEIFLPSDVRGWDKSIGAVQNAILDDEVGEFLKSYRRKGTDVWLIFDSCHSGTMTRGVGDDSVRARMVPDEALGIPPAQASGPLKSNGEAPPPSFIDGISDSEAGTGMLIVFSAAHTSEEAPEMCLPKPAWKSKQTPGVCEGRGPEKREVRGLLTHSLFAALSRFPGVSYRQLAQLIVDQYASLPWNSSRPQFYGTAMDRVVFNGSDRRNRLFKAVLDQSRTRLAVTGAGRLHGFDSGASFAVYSKAVDTEDYHLGRGTVVSAEATSAIATVHWDAEDKAPKRYRTPVYVRLVQPAYEPRVRITWLNTTEDVGNQRRREIDEGLKRDVPLVEFSADDQDADYFAAFFDGKFWLLRPSQTLPCSVRRISDAERIECERTRQPEQLLWSKRDLQQVKQFVSRAANARALTKLQGVVNTPSSLHVEVLVQGPSEKEPIALGKRAASKVLHAGDKLFLKVANTGSEDWDVFLFFVDSQLGITALQDPGRSARVLRDEKLNLRVGTITEDTLGVESLVIIAEPRREGIEADYYFLAQETWKDVTTRGRGAQSPFEMLLKEIQKDPESARTKGLKSDRTGAQAQLKVYTWTVQSRQ